jgi:hypothetical protein
MHGHKNKDKANSFTRIVLSSFSALKPDMLVQSSSGKLEHAGEDVGKGTIKQGDAGCVWYLLMAKYVYETYQSHIHRPVEDLHPAPSPLYK